MNWQSQSGQDRWIAEEVFPGVTDGIFVEAGAGDGIYLSNTHALAALGWHGLLVEPSEAFTQLQVNRTEPGTVCCRKVLHDRRHKEVLFRESQYSREFGRDDHHHLSGVVRSLTAYKVTGRTLSCPTTALTDLLRQHGFPRYIHYLSLDTEGTEWHILKELLRQNREPFYFGAITVEHNNNPTYQAEIRRLLTRYGYRYERTVEFDDWYTGPKVGTNN